VRVMDWSCPIPGTYSEGPCEVLERLGYRSITGVDLSAVQLARARENLRYTKLIHADVCQVPVEDNTFASALTFGVINCLSRDGQLELFIRECHRLLQPNAYWLINMYTRNDSEEFDCKYESGYSEFGIKKVFRSNNGMVFRHYSLAELTAITDPFFDLVACERQTFHSLHQRSQVTGYSIIMQKPIYRSRFR